MLFHPHRIRKNRIKSDAYPNNYDYLKKYKFNLESNIYNLPKNTLTITSRYIDTIRNNRGFIDNKAQ